MQRSSRARDELSSGIPYRIRQRTIITHAHRALLIDGLGHATWSTISLASQPYFSVYAHARAKVGGGRKGKIRMGTPARLS